MNKFLFCLNFVVCHFCHFGVCVSFFFVLRSFSLSFPNRFLYLLGLSLVLVVKSILCSDITLGQRVVRRRFFYTDEQTHQPKVCIKWMRGFHWPICRKTMMFVSVPVVDIILFSFARIFQSAHHKQLYPCIESFGLIWRDCIHKKNAFRTHKVRSYHSHGSLTISLPSSLLLIVSINDSSDECILFLCVSFSVAEKKITTKINFVSQQRKIIIGYLNLAKQRTKKP